MLTISGNTGSTAASASKCLSKQATLRDGMRGPAVRVRARPHQKGRQVQGDSLSAGSDRSSEGRRG